MRSAFSTALLVALATGIGLTIAAPSRSQDSSSDAAPSAAAPARHSSSFFTKSKPGAMDLAPAASASAAKPAKPAVSATSRADDDTSEASSSAAFPRTSATLSARPKPSPAFLAKTGAVKPAPASVAPAPVRPVEPTPTTATETTLSPTELSAFVDGAVAQAMARDHVAGVSVAVVQNGQLVLKKGYGFAGPHRAVDPDRTLFRLGGVSTSFTWIALMREVEANRLRLDAPVNLFLPERLQVRDQGYQRQIFVRDLMSQSSGFEDRTLGQLFEQDPAAVRPMFDYLRQERPRRVREPGVLPTYSDYGAVLAGAAITNVDGHPYQDVIEAQILRPLGLSHTSFREPYPARADLPAPLPATLAADLSKGYRWRDGGYQPQAFEYASQAAPAAAGSSTASDMARYMLALLADGQLEGASLYGPDTARGFRTTTLAAAPGLSGWDNGFMEIALPGGLRGQGLRGDTLWFHSSLVTVPSLNLGIFIATNTDKGAALARSLPDQIVSRFYAQPQIEPRPGAASLADDAATYDGTYLTTQRPYNGLGKLVFMLSGQMRVRVTPDGRLLTRGAGETRTWTADAAAGRLVAVDGPQTSAFQISNGKAQRWFAPSGAVAFDRIGPLSQTPTLAALAALAALASIATLIGQFTRDPREFRQTANQGRANLLQTTISVLWLIVLAAFGVWLADARDVTDLMYHWPGPLLLIASTCAFVAAILTALTVMMTPWIWRGGRRLDSWSAWRKLSFTGTTVIFALFSVVLGVWGALEPWSR